MAKKELPDGRPSYYHVRCRVCTVAWVNNATETCSKCSQRRCSFGSCQNVFLAKAGRTMCPTHYRDWVTSNNYAAQSRGEYQ